MKKHIRFLFVLFLLLCASVLAAEEVTLESEVLKLVLHGQNGSFSLFRKTGAKGKLVALNETSDNASSTFFSVKAADRFRPLRRSYTLSSGIMQNEDGSASLVWTADGAFSAEVKFALISTEPERPADSVRVDLRITNLGEMENVFAAKTVIDTVLGERGRIHFTTARGTVINSEKGYASFVQDKWLSSSNGKETVSLLLAGSAASATDYVLAASRDLLISDAWKPVIHEGRNLGTIQSPNNSAVGIWFKETTLKQDESVVYTFFITTAADGEVPPNAPLLGIETDAAPELDESTVSSATQIVDAAVSGGNTIPSLLRKNVDQAYVQQLFDRIKVIEESEKPDREEISRLNAEIDAIILELTR